MKSSTRSLALASVLGLSQAVTPVEKVIKLLEDLKAEVEADGTTEAAAYDEFSCFCKDMTATKSTSITTGQDTIDTESATIQEKTATKGQHATDLSERKGKQEKLTSELKATETRCSAEQASYEANDKDLVKAISSLEGALKALGDSKPAAAASFLAIRTPIQRSLILADALNLLQTPKRKAAAAFLQQKSSAAKVDPDDPEYKFKSQGVLDTIGELQTDFQTQKSVADEEWGKTNEACKDTKQSLSDEMTSNEDGMNTASEAISTLTEEIGGSRETLLESEAQLKDDKVYLKDLTSLCEVRAKDFDQRSQMRAGEVEALTGALTILTDRVQGADEAANQRALLQASKKVAAVNKTSTNATAASSKTPSFLQTVALHSQELEVSAQMKKVNRVIDFLQGKGQDLHSSVLSQLASKAFQPRFSATPEYDPFKKVKTLIQGLVERLLKEATAEATKKGFCDTELSKANNDRDARLEDANKLNAELAGLEAKKDALEQEIDSLTTELEDLRQDLNQTGINRKDEKAANTETLKTAREGLEAMKEAIAILKTFYKQAAKASSLLQVEKYSPVSDDTSGPGFEGSYGGKQGASKGVIGTLEVIKSDFERTISTTTSSEKKAAADFVEFDRTSKADIGSKETKKTLDEEDLETTKNNIAQGKSDLQTAMDLLDSALKSLEDLAPTCTDLTMPYEERVAKREQEMEALKSALCILDTEGVESDC